MGAGGGGGGGGVAVTVVFDATATVQKIYALHSRLNILLKRVLYQVDFGGFRCCRPTTLNGTSP